MTGRRWFILGLLIWLALAAGIGVRALYRLLNTTVAGSSYFHEPMASIDGVRAFTLQSMERSIVESNGASAWEKHVFGLVPDTQQPPPLGDKSAYWEAIAIDRPFHMTFRKPDGSVTGPHRVEFRERSYAKWADDGMSLTFRSGMTPILGKPFRPQGRAWNAAVTRNFLLQQFTYIVLIGIIIAVIVMTSWVVNEVLRRRPAHQCQVCGYDQRISARSAATTCAAARTSAVPNAVMVDLTSCVARRNEPRPVGSASTTCQRAVHPALRGCMGPSATIFAFRQRGVRKPFGLVAQIILQREEDNALT